MIEDEGGEELLSRALAGEADAFRALVVRHQRAVYSLAWRMLCDRQRAEDLAQEVFLQLHRHLASIESLAHLSRWLRRVTMHRAIDRLRREPPRGTASLEEAAELAAEEEQSDPLLRRRLQMLIAELPPAARAVLLLRYQEDLDPMEIGRTLKMSVNTVKSHLKRSLAMLREHLQDSPEQACAVRSRPDPAT
ncbi:MAG TPA: sigma-70 family RNA polymerase sigma factor [Steroidobacteraceae bacterium]|nr:sigma-70 family RNA polymerase sigma factor [Steroidobacteraceae bacterium]